MSGITDEAAIEGHDLIQRAEDEEERVSAWPSAGIISLTPNNVGFSCTSMTMITTCRRKQGARHQAP